MYFARPILLFATFAAAFTIPKGQPDGVYSVHTAEDGTETHTLIKLHDPSNSSVVSREYSDGPLMKRARATKRQIPNVDFDNPVESIACGGYFLDPGNTNAANGALDAQ